MTRRKNSRLKNVHRLMAEHPSAKYCIHDISRVFNVPTKDASSILNRLVKGGGVTKTFKETCDESQQIKHYHYRYLGKLGKSYQSKKQPVHRRGFGAVSRNLSNQVTQLRTENQKLKAKNEVLVEMLRDALKR